MKYIEGPRSLMTTSAISLTKPLQKFSRFAAHTSSHPIRSTSYSCRHVAARLRL